MFVYCFDCVQFGIAIHEGLYFQIVVASDLHVRVSDKDGRIVKGCWHMRFSHKRYSFITFTLDDSPNKPGLVGVYNRSLADHPNEPGSAGVYNRSLADHPGSQGQLEYTTGTWLTTQQTRVGWGIQ